MKISFLKTSALFLSLFVVSLLLPSCDAIGTKAAGDLMTQQFDETDFQGLELNVNAEAEVRIDSVFSVEITCEESVMPYVRASVIGGILKIDFSRNVYDVDDMKIVVSAPSWNYFELNGSGEVYVVDPIEGDLLRMDVSGSGNIRVNDATFSTANLWISGSGNLDLSGSGNNLRCHVSGSGDVDARDFPVETADLEVSGSGNIQVQVSEQLDADISGSGDIRYQGNPQINAHISGSGKLRRL